MAYDQQIQVYRAKNDHNYEDTNVTRAAWTLNPDVDTINEQTGRTSR